MRIRVAVCFRGRCTGGDVCSHKRMRECACASFLKTLFLCELKRRVRFSRAAGDGYPLAGDASSLVVLGLREVGNDVLK